LNLSYLDQIVPMVVDESEPLECQWPKPTESDRAEIDPHRLDTRASID
jgi:hypothetical protein